MRADWSAAFVAVVLHTVLSLLGPGERDDVPSVLALAGFVSRVDASRRSMRRDAVALAPPSLALTAVPLAAHGERGRLLAGLLALLALGTAAQKLAEPERGLYLASVGALLVETCAEIAAAGQRLAETRTTGGRLAVVGRFREEAAAGKLDDATLRGVRLALDHVGDMEEERAGELAAARAAMGSAMRAVAVIAESR